MGVVFHLYRGDDVEPVLVKAGKDLDDFARWAADQGGEVARLVVEGHTDPYRHQAIPDLCGQLVEATGETADALREAMSDDIQGALCVEEGPARYAAVKPAPDGKLHRDSFGYREAGGQPQSCLGCRYYQTQDAALGRCILFASLTQVEPQRYELSTTVGPEFWCEGWEQR